MGLSDSRTFLIRTFLVRTSLIRTFLVRTSLNRTFLGVLFQSRSHQLSQVLFFHPTVLPQGGAELRVHQRDRHHDPDHALRTWTSQGSCRGLWSCRWSLWRRRWWWWKGTSWLKLSMDHGTQRPFCIAQAVRLTVELVVGTFVINFKLMS